jgi:uncharacterized membrane protein YedE/YeeE
MSWISADLGRILFPFASLFLGILIGYLGQRSGFCSIGGIRDFILFKHTRLLFGYLALILSAFGSYLLFNWIITDSFPNYFWASSQDKIFQPIPGAPGGLTIGTYIFLAIIGGLGLGLTGVLLGGCPLRQIIMASEGNSKSMIFIIGTLIGSILFHLWIAPGIIALFGS